MDDPYGLADLRQLMATRGTQFTSIPPHTQPLQPPSFSAFHHHRPDHHHHHQLTSPYDPSLMTLASNTHFPTQTPACFATTSGSSASLCGLGMDPCRSSDMGGEAVISSRWPRQETLTLLDIRSRLDAKFKEANQKGPLWDEVSRIMAEEHGYSRSGKKCREKFENLYKYYKKTKEGKAGRQDGKNYRFFRQLEAIYGASNTSHRSSSDNYYTPLVTDSVYGQMPNDSSSTDHQANGDQSLQGQRSLSFSNSSSHEFETSSSENNEDDLSAIAYMMNGQYSSDKKKRVVNESESISRSKKGWKDKVKQVWDSQMMNFMERQEAWMENMLKTIELKEQERVVREIEWKNQEMARINRESELWAKQRAWIEARDSALMDALRKLTAEHGGGDKIESIARDWIAEEEEQEEEREQQSTSSFIEPETLTLIQLMTNSELGLQDQCGYLREGFWEAISEKMVCLGFNKSAGECHEKWENIRNSLHKISGWNKKQR